MKVNEINCETGEEILRDPNEAELFVHNNAAKESQEFEKRLQKQEKEKAVLFDKLGITAEEAKLLLS
jgi:hypothetical protein